MALLAGPSAAVDPQPSFSIDDVTVSEGAGTTTFTVTLSDTTLGGSVAYATADGGATDGADYTAASGTLTFDPASPSTQTIPVSISNDSIAESSEQFSLVLSNPSLGTTIGQGTGTGTITDDDPAPTLSIGNAAAVTEGAAGASATFGVSLSGSTTQTVTVHYATANGSAGAPADYDATSGDLTFTPGSPTTQNVAVSVNDDSIDEPDETFVVNLSGAANATLGDSQGVGTINDDDNSPTASVGNASASEGQPVQFPVTLSNASWQPVTVNYHTTPGTASSSDFTGTPSASISIPAGQTSGTITAQTTEDVVSEQNETFTVTITSPSVDTATGTINDDDAVPSLSINNSVVTEGNAGTSGPGASFTVRLSSASGQEVRVNYATADGTATTAAPNPDYQAASSTLVFDPGQTTKTITVPINGDLIDESDSETFTVSLSGAVDATISDASGTGTINDDDPVPMLSIGDASMLEGNSGTSNMAFAVELSTASGRSVTVNYSTTAGTAGTPGDFATTSGSLTFAPGQTTRTLSVPVIGDTVDEANQTFTVNLSGPTNATIVDGAATGTIIDDDGVPALSVLDAPEVIEGNSGTSPATFEVRLAPASGQNVTVSWSTVGGGSGTSGTDFAAASGSLTFTPGQTSKTFSVSVVGDTNDEADLETFLVRLTRPVNAIIADIEATGRIVDDDSPPAIPPPEATTVPASALTQTTATVGGTVNPKGRTTTVYFEYGLTEEYGTRTGNQTASGTSTQAFSAGLTGLGSGTTYHFRIVATNDAGGTTYGSDMTFTTASPPPPPQPPATTVTTTTTRTPLPPPPPPPPVGIGPKFELTSSTGIGFNGTVILHVSCPEEACDGVIELATAVDTKSFLGGTGRRTVVLGDGTFSVRQRGQTAALVKLSKEGWKLLRQKKKLQAKASIVARNKNGAPTAIVKDVRIALIRSPISFGRRIIRALPSGLVELRLTCIEGRAPCRGTIGLAAKVRGSKRATRLGSEPFTLPAGRTDVVSVLLNDKGRKLLLKQRQLRVSVKLRVRMGSGPSATVLTKITLKAPRRGFQ